MKFVFTYEQEMLRQTVRSFAKKELTREYLRALDEGAHAPKCNLLPMMASLGFTALMLPSEFGGLDGGAIDGVALLEELGRSSLAVASILTSAIGFGCEALKRAGTASQQREIFEKLVRGELHFAYAAAGPGSDSDSAVVVARADKNQYILDGSNILVTGTRNPNYLIIAAQSEHDASHLRLFILEPTAAGITGYPIETSGLRGIGAFHMLNFKAVRVPATALLSSHGDNVLAALMHARLLEAATCVGCAQQAVDDAVRYAGEREQFGQPIGKFQAISHLLVDLQVDVDAARALLYRAAWMSDAGRECAREVSMAHLASSEALLRTASDAMRVYGGYGMTMEFDVQRHLRDARLFVVGDGASRSQRDLVARSMGLTK